jgi:hypothetical protein
MAKTWWDVKPQKKETNLQDYQIKRWLSQVPHGGVVGENAVLIVYNEKHPSQSVLIVEGINS